MFSYKLFTPGPLNTTLSVKQAMCEDLGNSKEFDNLSQEIHESLLRIAKLSPSTHSSVLLPGSGTFGVEATLRTAVSENDKILIAANGAYGERMIKICSLLNIPHKILRYEERDKVAKQDVLDSLSPDITHFAMVHSETTTGILNPISEVAKAVKEKNKNVVIIGDCVSSFGAVSADFSNLDFIVTCSNKLLQGVPGLALVIAKSDVLGRCEGNARSAYLDLHRIVSSGKNFLVMPPYQSVRSLHKAIEEFWEEGGLEAREKRYQNNLSYLKTEMEKMGFKYYVRPEDQGWIISTFLEPKDPNYNFKVFYQYLVDRGIVIYPGKLSKLPTFRIGTIGELHQADMKYCVECINDAFLEMKVKLPLQ